MVVTAILTVSSVLATGRGLERAGWEAYDCRCRVERCRSGVHVLVCAHLLPETSPAIAEPHLHSGFGEFGSGNENKNRTAVSADTQNIMLNYIIQQFTNVTLLLGSHSILYNIHIECFIITIFVTRTCDVDQNLNSIRYKTRPAPNSLQHILKCLKLWVFMSSKSSKCWKVCARNIHNTVYIQS